MILQPVNLQALQQESHIAVLERMDVGESLFFTDLQQAHSLRSLSYYMVRSRKLPWKFTFRKMDRGWRLIRVL